MRVIHDEEGIQIIENHPQLSEKIKNKIIADYLNNTANYNISMRLDKDEKI